MIYGMLVHNSIQNILEQFSCQIFNYICYVHIYRQIYTTPLYKIKLICNTTYIHLYNINVYKYKNYIYTYILIFI